jgi:hypothetical protein
VCHHAGNSFFFYLSGVVHLATTTCYYLLKTGLSAIFAFAFGDCCMWSSCGAM